MTVLLGAVAYDPKVVTIWFGFREWLRKHDLDFDFILYSNYERQAEDLVAGRIDVAWNSPLAWLRCERLAAARGLTVTALLMRDTDQDLTSVFVVRADSRYQTLADLKGARVALGAIDSPQATLIPLAALADAGLLPGCGLGVTRFDVGVGLHGDHIGGERDAVRALLDGRVDAAAIIDANHLGFGRDGTIPAGSVRIIGQTTPFDHCNLTVVDTAPADEIEKLRELLESMSYDDETVRPLLDLEGLTRWVPGRTSGYEVLDTAVDLVGFYDAAGNVTATDYRP
ncbi:PhnD/SsuA/transferrin family substrate-binding protein [Mycobacterium sp. ST-F2]|uniref:phosphate/phosphite/phosphonate ABC transporter substrate-binding protein n=1 Tax=Mycobacterium sp. ST-F2 TaxID=1490484 RepID=UPI0009FB0EFD|nr:PhnD/SsuA/transferrin family substrate-binding protein [Mycobacterium sp. ST-F2]